MGGLTSGEVAAYPQAVHSTLAQLTLTGTTPPVLIISQDEDFRATSGSEPEADDSASEGPLSPRSTPFGSQPQTPVLDHPEAEESSALFLEPLLTDAEIAKVRPMCQRQTALVRCHGPALHV